MSSIDPTEIARFSRHAEDWWNPEGALRPLHKLNPSRLEYIRDQICTHFSRKAGGRDALKGLSILDIGCGGGLLTEPLARLGAQVTGLDASAQAIQTAQQHAAQSGLPITYHTGSAEDFARGQARFDVITALEILEHVGDRDALMQSLSHLLKPGGVVILSTLNRDAKSYLLGIVAAEYVLRWVPRGTHDWRKFIRPSELAAQAGQVGLEATDITGLTYDPLNDVFRLRKEKVAVNYLMTFVGKRRA